MKPLLFVLRYAKKHLQPLIAAAISTLALVGVQLYSPWIIKTMVGTINDSGITPEALQEISSLALLALGVYAAQAILQFLRSYLSHVAGWHVVAETQKHIYRHLQRLSLRFYEDKQTGELLSRSLNDPRLFEQLIAHAIPDVAVNILSLIAISIILISLNRQLMLLSLIPVPFIVIGMRLVSKYVRPAFRERQRELGELNAAVNDNLAGIREIKGFVREEVEIGRIGYRIERYRDSMLHALRMMATFRPFVGFVSALGTVGLIYFGGRLALLEVLALEDLVAFFLYLGQFYQPVQALSGAWEGIQEALAGAERTAELLEETPDVEEKADAIQLTDRAKGEIVFDNVQFQYTKGGMVLEDVTLTVPSGTSVALVGPTGVGKTTLASLVPRFYDATGGSISLDGHDLRDLSLNSLRDQISIVRQEVFLFHGTARENVLFGRHDATDEEMIDAAKTANAHEFIQALPDGYGTIIGERGVKLSGGQRQRIAIARAVLKDTPILILDEATSSVDTETEALIHQALERLIAGRTTIIIAHRLSTIRNADAICVLEGNRIVEVGTHEELMAQEGLYHRLNEVQFDEDTRQTLLAERQQQLMADD